MLPERDINWALLGAASSLPLALALVVAWPFWRKGSLIAGNTAGLAVLFVSCLIAGGVEYVEALRFAIFCEGNATGCRPTEPSDFIRLSAFGFIAMVQAMVLYVISALKERQLQRAHYESRWR